MEEIILLVGIFLVDVFPFICEAFGSFLLMFPEGVEVRNGIDSSLPFISNVSRKFLFPDIEKFLMCLKKILLQLLGENSRDTIDDGVPGVFCGDDSIVYVSAFFFEYGDIEWLVRNWIRQVLQMISSHMAFQ